MARARTIELGWTHPETEDDFRVTLEFEPGSPGGWEEAPSGPELRVLKVTEDRPGGAERPDLIATVEAELDGPWGDRAADEIGDSERDAYAAYCDDQADRDRDARGEW